MADRKSALKFSCKTLISNKIAPNNLLYCAFLRLHCFNLFHNDAGSTTIMWTQMWTYKPNASRCNSQSHQT